MAFAAGMRAGVQRDDSKAANPGGLTAARLRILVTSDLHHHLLPYDYFADRPAPGRGLSVTAALIREARAECGATLLLDNGDTIQGNPMSDLVAAEPVSSRHPMIEAMNRLGYDAAIPGNHDFDYGLDVFARAYAGANFPVLAANAIAPPDRSLAFLVPSVLIRRTVGDDAGQRHTVCVGLVGLVPPMTVKGADGSVFAAGDPLPAARAASDALRLSGADVVVALAHVGLAGAGGDPLAWSVEALAGLPGIDVVLGGHSHEVFPIPDVPQPPGAGPVTNTILGKPVVLPGFFGSHLGIVDLTLARVEGAWRVVAARSEARPAAAGPLNTAPEEDEAIVSLAAPWHRRTLEAIRRPIGRSAVALHTHFAFAGDSAALRLIGEAKADYVARTLSGTTEGGLPVLAAVAPFRAGGRGGPENYTDIPAGEVQFRHLADLYSYPNHVRALRLRGAAILDWLERAASFFPRIVPGRHDQPLRHPDVPSYKFEILAGLTYRIDPSRPARYAVGGAAGDPSARRVSDVKFRGKALDPDAEFILATNSHRATDPSLAAAIVPLPQRTIRDILHDHVAGQPDASPRIPPVWQFAPIPDTTAVFDAGSSALCYMADPGLPDLEHLGTGPSGGSRFRLRF